MPAQDDESDSDIEAKIALKKKRIAPLPLFDHSKETYEEVNFNFYNESKQVASLDANQVRQILFKHDIRILGEDPPKPIVAFSDLLIDQKLLNVIKQQKYYCPTPIQMAALPCALSGRDVIGIAKTGSGKTLAYILPMIMHVLDQVYH